MLHPAEKTKTVLCPEMFRKRRRDFRSRYGLSENFAMHYRQMAAGRLVALGTDGFGRSDSRSALRNYFEVDSRFIVLAALQALAADGKISSDVPQKAIGDLHIDTEKINPALF